MAFLQPTYSFLANKVLSKQIPISLYSKRMCLSISLYLNMPFYLPRASVFIGTGLGKLPVTHSTWRSHELPLLN